MLRPPLQKHQCYYLSYELSYYLRLYLRYTLRYNPNSNLQYYLHDCALRSALRYVLLPATLCAELRCLHWLHYYLLCDGLRCAAAALRYYL